MQSRKCETFHSYIKITGPKKEESTWTNTLHVSLKKMRLSVINYQWQFSRLRKNVMWLWKNSSHKYIVCRGWNNKEMNTKSVWETLILVRGFLLHAKRKKNKTLLTTIYIVSIPFVHTYPGDPGTCVCVHFSISVDLFFHRCEATLCVLFGQLWISLWTVPWISFLHSLFLLLKNELWPLLRHVKPAVL